LYVSSPTTRVCPALCPPWKRRRHRPGLQASRRSYPSPRRPLAADDGDVCQASAFP
jgi:hypothetical protein